jgi:carbon monoxide dehydrogenase subunit G
VKITETALFACPIEVLWDHVEDPQKQKLWMKGLISNESTSPARQGVGSTFKMKLQERGKVGEYDGEVTAHDKPHRLEVVFWGGGLPAESNVRFDYRFSEAGGQTRLDYACTIEMQKRGLYGWLMLITFKLLGRRQLRSVLGELRKHVEAPAKAA